MNYCYNVIEFTNDEEGHQLRFELSGFPNGTSFNQSPVHMRDNKMVWVSWGNPDDGYVKNNNGVKKFTPTNITSELDFDAIANELNCPVSRDSPELCTFLDNVFGEYY